MSQEATVILELARSAYMRAIPHLRPASVALLTTSVGAMLLGPVGIIPGAAVGAMAPVWAEPLVRGFTMVVEYVRENPGLLLDIMSVIQMLRGLIRNSNLRLEHES